MITEIYEILTANNPSRDWPESVQLAIEYYQISRDLYKDIVPEADDDAIAAEFEKMQAYIKG